eukprot:TRINITY_DN2729_c0_g1_i2.p1 TRINITY_DN2729_c0_g1~~TRINITY_DN2729_c0_g1_i2.p1  ORF type:complete len:581 (+),score=100.38 TRINITY_DN2729_c0_g1_i2:64-1806(+)
MSLDHKTQEKKVLMDRLVYVGEKATSYSDNKVVRTKYSFWMIFFVTLSVVFSNKENIYFLIVGLVQVSTFPLIGLLPQYLSPTGPWGTAGPLLGTVMLQFLLLLFAWVKGTWEDLKENSNEIKVVHQSNTSDDILIEREEQHKLVPGDVIYLQKGEVVPTDIITLAIDESDAVATFTATDLTGEPGNIPSVPIDGIDLKDCLQLRARIRCFSLGSNINEFEGDIALGKELPVEITSENTIPAGAIITSNGVYGVTYASGPDRKSMLDIDSQVEKKNHLEKIISRFMIYNVYLLVIMIVVCTALSLKYDKPSQDEIDTYGKWFLVVRAVQNFMIYNGMIPLSLSINIGIIRMLQMIQLQSKNIQVNNVTLTGDLYRTHYILSDKTGTITKNEMVFTSLCDRNGNIFTVSPTENQKGVDLHLLRCLGLCNTASISSDEAKKFDAKNQEDLTIVERSIYLGCELVSRQGDNVKLDIIGMGRHEEYQVLREFEFSSERKRMSVVLRNKETGRVFINTKGAMNILEERMDSEEDIKCMNDAVSVLETEDDTLRLMACAYRDVTDEWESFAEKLSLLIINTYLKKF